MEKLHIRKSPFRWEWLLGNDDSIIFYTDHYGEGIFRYDRRSGETIQIAAPGDFSLWEIRNPRAKIRRAMKKLENNPRAFWD